MRIVSVWLPRWPILRFLAAQARNPSCAPVDPERPFVLATDASGGPRIAASNEAAEREGLAAGDLLADARAKAEMLQVRTADRAADDVALRRLVLWATRYTPIVSPWGEGNGADGFFLDITGAAHLFGGEEALLADLARRLQGFGLPARLAIAGTAGAAWALARFHSARTLILLSGQEREALASLPIEALRLTRETRATLRRLGFKRVGTLIDKPRAPFAARFEAELLQRLDQAFGRAPEPLPLIAPPPVYHHRRHLLEPIVTQEAIVAVAARLVQDLVPILLRDGVGARCLRLMLYRLDGEVTAIDIGLALPTRNAAHVSRLIDLKLERIAESFDADFAYGFGFEALDLAVTVAERIEERQLEMNAVADASEEERCAALLDSLRQRLGPASVRRLQPVASHLPERAEILRAAAADIFTWPVSDPARSRPRPLFLLARAEPAEVTALVPEGPPRRFRWRGAIHEVVDAQGPERIACEWWRHDQPTRDYFLVEDGGGRRFWLYRQGLYGRGTAEPRWFVHGLFA
jgi:protein ImuB